MTRTILSAILICLIGNTAFSQVGTICNWDNDKNAAVVLTFDDWTPGQYPIAVPELKKRNINATFYLILSSVSSNHPWPDVIKAAFYGNEIANHTQTHPDLTKVTATQLSAEIRGMKDTINKHITSQTVLTFAYPYGAFNAAIIDSLKKSGHIAARSVFPSSGNYTYHFAAKEDDYFQILTFSMDGTKSTSTFFQEIKNIIKGGGLLTYLYHSVDDAKGTYSDNWYAKVLKDSFQKQLDTLCSVKNKVWITTFGQAIKYHREASCGSISEISAYDGKQWVINLTDTLSNHTLYNQPLSIKLKMNGISYSEVLQNNRALKIDSVYNDTILFHAIPNGGHIILKSSPKAIKKRRTP
jgi:peptidoglycan/xylan/chitin deacetylase (PgdA/CDA1 family)